MHYFVKQSWFYVWTEYVPCFELLSFYRRHSLWINLKQRCLVPQGFQCHCVIFYSCVIFALLYYFENFQIYIPLFTIIACLRNRSPMEYLKFHLKTLIIQCLFKA